METFDTDWLQKQGIDVSADRLQDLSAVLAGELEMRVGGVIAEYLTDAQIDEFEALIDATPEDDPDEILIKWLGKAYPDYPKVVAAQKAKLSRQIRLADDKIAFITALQD